MPSFLSRMKTSASAGGSKRLIYTVLGVGVVACVAVYLTSGGLLVQPSVVNGPTQNQVTVQGRIPVSPNYGSQLSQQDQQRVAKAQETGSSAMPTVRVQENLLAGLPSEPAAPAPDLSKLPRPQPPQVVRPDVSLPPPPNIAPVAMRVVENPQQVEAANAMLRGVMGDLGKRSYAAADVKYYYKGVAPGASNAAASQAQSATGSAPTSGSIGGIPLPLPGTILYAELVGEANSDAPGPILAKVLQGELAGATLIGSFGAQRDTLILKFSTISLGTSAAGDDVNKTVGVNAVGVDSTNVGPGIATDVDHHFLVNVGTQAAAAFAQGFASALSQSGSTISQSAYGTTYSSASRGLTDNLRIGGATGVAAGAQAMAQTYGNRPTTIKIASGTPIGILFLPSNTTNGY